MRERERHEGVRPKGALVEQTDHDHGVVRHEDTLASYEGKKVGKIKKNSHELQPVDGPGGIIQRPGTGDGVWKENTTPSQKRHRS